MNVPSNPRLLRAASVLALVALALMIWSLFDATVWPLMIALTLGQAIGTLSFAIFLFVVARDLRVRAKLRKATTTKP